MFEMLDEFYVDGNYDVQSTISYTVVTGAVRDDDKLFERACGYMTTYAPHLLAPVKNIMQFVVPKENKKK